MGLVLRRMEPRDLSRAALLACQLGYPTTVAEITARFARLASLPDDYICVADAEDVAVAGWIHLHAGATLESDPQVEVRGLVVDATLRRRHIGRALMAEAERWARERGAASIRLRSNVVREEAQAFYLRLGFRIVKTQHALEKALGPTPGPT